MAVSSILVMSRSLDNDEEAVVINSVRHQRELRGLSQASLGDALGVSRQTINSIETGKYDPSLPLAFALSRFFSCTIEELFDDSAN